MVNLRTHDDYTFTHATNVAVLTLGMAQSLGIADSEIHDLVLGGLFHDIGKLMVPRDVLNKPGRLTAEDMELIQRHPVDGARFLLSLPNISETAVIVTFEHHMKLDGGGYPKLGGVDKPHLYAQILAVADIHDALRTDRPYREALSPEKAASIMMKMAEGELNPDLTRRFFHLMGIYPPGTMVRLDTGEIGVVKRGNPSEPMRPLVKIVYDNRGSPVTSPSVISLGEEGEEKGRSARVIKESLGVSSAELFQYAEDN
jgi:putative nucleotidyltransferase with HDIG domain